MIGRPLQHGGEVYYAAFSSNGKRLVTCGKDHTACLWDTRTCEPIGKRLRHDDIVTLGVFSLDGRTVATASLDGVVRVWDELGGMLGVLEYKRGHAWGLRFDPSGSLLVIAFYDRIMICDVSSQQEVSPAMYVESQLVRGDFPSALMFEKLMFVPLLDDRSVDDLVKLAQLHSGRQLNTKGGTVPVGRQQQQALWQDLRARYADEFAVPSQAMVAWRLKQLKLAYEAKQTAAVTFWLALELTESEWQPGETDSPDYFQRLNALAQFGRSAEATAAADSMAVRWPKEPGNLYACACVYALAAGASKGEAALAERYAARAVALLLQVTHSAYKDLVRTDADLDALRDRPDFQKLLKERSSN